VTSVTKHVVAASPFAPLTPKRVAVHVALCGYLIKSFTHAKHDMMSAFPNIASIVRQWWKFASERADHEGHHVGFQCGLRYCSLAAKFASLFVVILKIVESTLQFVPLLGHLNQQCVTLRQCGACV
jgi:hypothetical protein